MEGLEFARLLSGLNHSPIVYFIRMGDRVKIGTTTNLVQRVNALSLALPDVAKVVMGGKEMEALMHERYAEYRVYENREWFDVRGSLAEYLPTLGSRRTVAIPDEAEGFIVGIDAAASFLGMSQEAFIGARKRNAIKGERRIGRRPAWTETNLKAWHYERPRAGKRNLKPNAA
ncbi:GIY-YIG nuclease family protein [Streptomyces sp. NPDC002643]